MCVCVESGLPSSLRLKRCCCLLPLEPSIKYGAIALTASWLVYMISSITIIIIYVSPIETSYDKDRLWTIEIWVSFQGCLGFAYIGLLLFVIVGLVTARKSFLTPSVAILPTLVIFNLVLGVSTASVLRTALGEEFLICIIL